MIFGRAYPIKSAVFIGRQTFSGAGGTANISLDATEAQDTAALQLELISSIALAATEASDTAAFTLTLTSSIALAATEAQDTAALNLDNGSVGVALDATEAQDVAALSLTLTSSIALAATEASDTASLLLQTTSSIALAATEAQDIAALNVNVFDAAVNIALAVTEAQDIASFSFLPAGGGKSGRWQEGQKKLLEHRRLQSIQVRTQNPGIQKSASILARAGGHARAASLTATQRSNIASTAAKARWR